MSDAIICPHCKKPFEISEAIQSQIEGELIRAKSEQSESLRREYDASSEAKLKQAVQSALEEARQDAELMLDHQKQTSRLELDKTRQTLEFEALKAKNASELEAELLRSEAQASKKAEEQLRKQLSELLEELSKANLARDEAGISARKELLEKEKGIREEAILKASEDFNNIIREQKETIERLREQLTTAKQVAEQGSQQLQGETLELDIESSLRAAFPFDTIEEVKKGERGSDIRQVVNEQRYMNCGLILWECKNAKTYQASWLSKLKDELAEEKAQIGVIVFNPTDGGGDDFKQLNENVWLVKPRYAVMIASLLREAITKVYSANKAQEGKDVKVEMLYNYLTGGEFLNRIRYILESYDEMSKLLESEKKQTQKRWAAQEKTILKATNSLYGMSGDLAGISGRDIIPLPELEDGGEAPMAAF